MSTKQIEAKINQVGNNNKTSMLIRAGDVVLQTEFSELAPCEFSVWNSSPVHVEMPPQGSKDFVAGQFFRLANKAAHEEYSNPIKFPVYSVQETATAQSFDRLNETVDSSKNSLNKIPLVAISSTVSHQIDEIKRVQNHCTLPIWNDGSAILVRLDWYEGESGEGACTPEWHMSASAGMPLELGLLQFCEASLRQAVAKNAQYILNFSPCLLGEKILGSKGTPILHKIWQRQWTFARREDFVEALKRIQLALTKECEAPENQAVA